MILLINIVNIAVSGLNGKEITGSFYEKELQKISQEKFRIEKVLKRKGDKLYVKWKGYDNRFNSWIDKKDLEWNFLNKIFLMKFLKCNLLNEIFKWNYLNEIFKWNFINKIF